MLLLWQVASATIDRARSHSEIKTIINELPSRVEESTVQNTKGQHKRHRVHKNLFDGAVVPSPRIINGVSVSSRLSFYELCVFETSPTLPNLIHIAGSWRSLPPRSFTSIYQSALLWSFTCSSGYDLDCGSKFVSNCRDEYKAQSLNLYWYMFLYVFTKPVL